MCKKKGAMMASVTEHYSADEAQPSAVQVSGKRMFLDFVILSSTY